MRLFFLAAVVVGVSIVSSRPAAQAAVLDLSTRALVSAAARYVTDYQEQLTAVVADETYSQEVRAQVPEQPGAPRSRSIRSEVFFMFARFEHQWMAIREVAEVDGVTVTDHPDLRASLQTMSATRVAAAFKRANSRFNIGRVTRNFNEPTVALVVLDADHRERFKFERKSVAKSDDTTLATLDFVEKSSSTLIRDLRDRPVYSKGSFIIEADTGRVRRTVLRTQVDRLKVELTTDYGADAKLQMWVPSVFRERYEQGEASHGREYELVLGEARYSNYRRFEVLSRIK